MTEEPLAGGNITREVVRVGDTVHRSRGAGSGFAAEVLLFLEAAGYPHAPRYLGRDERGRDVLSYVPGSTTDHPAQRAPGAYGLGGRMLRELHDATAGHLLAAGGECVLHGDPGPFNTIFQDGLPVAFIDWDFCEPGDRVEDLGYMAWTWCLQTEGHVPLADQARHLREVWDGYDDSSGIAPEALLDAIVRRQTDIVRTETANLTDPRHTPERRRHARAAVDWATAGRALVQRHRELLLGALA